MLDQLALGLAGGGGVYLQQYLANKMLDRANTKDFPTNMFGMPTDPDGIVDKLRDNSGVTDIRMNHHQIPQMGRNTMFAEIKSNATPEERAGIGVGASDRDVILFHPDAGREIIAHELGHAQISRGINANRATQLNQKVAGNLNYQRLAALPIGSAAAGAIANDPLQAAALGVGASLLIDSPQLVNEFQANRRALKMLDETGLKRKGSFGRIAGLYATYPLASVAKGLSGAALGYGAKSFFSGDGEA